MIIIHCFYIILLMNHIFTIFIKMISNNHVNIIFFESFTIFCLPLSWFYFLLTLFVLI